MTKAMPRWVVLFCAAVGVNGRIAAADDAPVTLAQADGRVEIAIAGKPFAAYVYADAAIPRPYFTGVHAPHGAQATRNQPPVAGQDLTDHPTFHPGVWLAFGDLSGADDWRLAAPVVHAEFLEPPHGEAGRGGFAVRNRYLPAGGGGDPICDELFRCDVHVVPAGYLIAWDSTFSAPREFAFGDQEEMGLGFRVATAIRAQRQAEAGVPGGNGEIRDAAGRVNEKQVWGQSADWCDYSGEIDGRRVGLTMFCHPQNFRPSWFHARDRGLLVANPFGRAAFHQGEPSKVIVKPGESLRLRYGVLVHATPADAAAPDLAAAFHDYVARARE
jgi:hypothetical protein